MDSPPRILIWDLESTGLRADFGRLLCFSYKWHGEKTVHLETIRGTKAFQKPGGWDGDDSELVRKLHKLLSEADSLVHHFGDRFDLKFFKTRLLELGLCFPSIHTVDTWKVAKKHLLLQSNRMANIADFLGGEQKSSVPKRDWIKANFGNAVAIKKLEKYCKQDVATLAGIYEKLLPYTNTINHNLFHHKEGCPKCGCTDTKLSGFRYTAIGKIQRMACKGCHTWFDAGRAMTKARLR